MLEKVIKCTVYSGGSLSVAKGTYHGTNSNYMFAGETSTTERQPQLESRRLSG